MKRYLINKNSFNLLIFFTGWGCDEYEFEHLKSNSDVLLLYDYSDSDLDSDLDFKFDFDFSKYKEINLIAFSAGGFIASVFDFGFIEHKINQKIAISSNPYLFDEHFGLSRKIQDILCNVTEENADDFAKNYLIKTEEEWKNFHHSKRTATSCKKEFESLKKLYEANRKNIKDIFDSAIIGEDDKIFDVSAQKEFYGKRLKILENSRHSLFFGIKSYEELLNLLR